MWNKEGMKYCWTCKAILPFKIEEDKLICLRCSQEIKPPDGDNK